MRYELHHGDCLEVMPTLQAGSVAMVFADLPYGTTDCHWDRESICLEKLWISLWRMLHINGLAALSAAQPFATDLVVSQRKLFRYDLVFEKGRAAGWANAGKMPMRAHEHVLCFYRKLPTYNPQMTAAAKIYSQIKAKSSPKKNDSILAKLRRVKQHVDTGLRYPRSVLHVRSEQLRYNAIHPTQKPVALLEWLIATYTNPGETVLDPVMGSGTTGHACANLGRRFIGIEKDAGYFVAAKERIEKAYAEAKL